MSKRTKKHTAKAQAFTRKVLSAPPKRPKRHFAAPTKTIWILVDASNSNQRSKNYLWWFETRALARKHMDHVRQVYPDGALLIGPYKYKLDEKKAMHWRWLTAQPTSKKKNRRGRTR